MTRARLFSRLLLAAIFLLSGCGGGGGGGGGTPTAALPPFPAFTETRSDFLDTREGLAADPMKVSASPCVNLPAVDWQDWLCSGAQALPTVYAVTNGFTTAADPHFAWIISLNNEFVQIPRMQHGPAESESRPE